jgi:ribosomal-protein-alanine N-acetyltransferase
MTPERLAELHALCFTVPRPWSVQEFQDLLKQDAVRLIPHEHGFALGMLMGPEAELLTLAVDPLQRRQGIATQLIDALEATCRDLCVEEIFLEVVETNDPARALYDACGYSCKGARKDYYTGPKGTKSSAVVMAKRL